MKDTVHAAVHRSVHLFGEGKTYGALRLRFKRPLILDEGKTPEWAGATPPRRTIAARSLRASGVTPASSCSGIAARVLAARRGSSNGVVRQPVIQNRKGGIKRKHGNHQSTTQTTEDGNDPGPSRGVGEGTARSVCRVHRLLYVICHHRGAETSVQARRRVQALGRPTH